MNKEEGKKQCEPKKNVFVYHCTYLYVFIIAIEGPARGYPLRTCLLQFFNRAVRKKTLVLNQVIFWILERFLLLNHLGDNTQLRTHRKQLEW